MISQECISKVGYLDEIYGMGYGDETDYQFKSMEKGFEAKVAIDTYVFHKAEQSFNTTNKMRSERLEKNRKIFFDRWGDQYYKLLKEYEKNDPIKYINDHVTKEDKIPKLDFTFVLPQMGKGTGGVLVITQLVNYLSMLGKKVGMLNLYTGSYDEIMNFESITPNQVGQFESKYLIATIFDSVFITKKLAEKMNAKLIYFSQGYEFMFLDGTKYGKVEASFWLADYIITISDYLKNSYNKLFNVNPIKISNGIDYNILHREKKEQKDRKNIILNLRNETLKGGFILNDVVKRLTLELDNIDITIINNAKDFDFGINNNKTVSIDIVKGPIKKMEMYKLMEKADILVDSSLSEGFGLLPLEAMCIGTVPVVSNALGNMEYCVNGENAIIIEKVNDPDAYVTAIKELVNDSKKLEKLRKNGIETAANYDVENQMLEYYKVMEDIESNKIKKINRKLTKVEEEKLEKYALTDAQYNKIIFLCKTNYLDIHSRKSTRLHNLKVLAKEFIKSNVYILKQTIKTITNKHHKL